MLISVDIKGISEHIPFLYKERAEAQALIECLRIWHEKAVLEGATEAGRIEQLLQIAYIQEQSIQRRIDALNDAVDQFSDVDKTVKGILNDTVGRIRGFEEIF